MKRKVLALMLVALLVISLAACGKGKETTVTGMVAAVEGTVVSIVEMSGNRGNVNSEKGERPSMPEGFDGQMPEGFDGTMPNGENFPQWGEKGERPEGQTMPSMPEGVERPSFNGEDGKNPSFEGERPNMGGNFMENMKTTQIDIGDAHISVETDGIKASGTLSDIRPGVFVTITRDGKEKVTNVLVTSMLGFGGNRFGNT